MEKRIINLTKHVVNVQTETEGWILENAFEPSGTEARVTSKQENFYKCMRHSSSSHYLFGSRRASNPRGRNNLYCQYACLASFKS